MYFRDFHPKTFTEITTPVKQPYSLKKGEEIIYVISYYHPFIPSKWIADELLYI